MADPDPCVHPMCSSRVRTLATLVRRDDVVSCGRTPGSGGPFVTPTLRKR